MIASAKATGDHGMIDPALLQSSPPLLSPPTRPPPPRPSLPAASHPSVYDVPIQAEPDGRCWYGSALQYLNHFPAPPINKLADLPQPHNHQPQDCHNTSHCPMPNNSSVDQLPSDVTLKRTHSLQRSQRLISQLPPCPNVLRPSPSRPSLGSSSPSSSTVASPPLRRCYSSPQTRSPSPPSNPFQNPQPRTPRTLEDPPRDRPLSDYPPSSEEHHVTCTDSLCSRTYDKISAPELDELWTPHASDANDEIAAPIDLIASDLDYSFRRLINLQLFQQLLDDPSGRLTFRQAIIDGLSTDVAHDSKLSLAKLDLWLDCKGIIHLLEVLKSCSLGLHGLYANPASNSNLLRKVLPDSQMSQLTGAIRTIQSIRLEPPADAQDDPTLLKALDLEEGTSWERRETQRALAKAAVGPRRQASHHTDQTVELRSVEDHLLRSLYKNEFPLFIKKTLISSVQVRLGRVDLNDASHDGMGECFCLTNPRLKDHPIVLVSDAFTKVTGYERQSIIGKNCRVLEPLLKAFNGFEMDFIGGQINVTGMLSSKKGLSFLMTDPNGKTLEQPMPEPCSTLLGLNKYSLSTNMQQFTSRETSLGTAVKSVLTDVKNQALANSSRDHNAAGSITFNLSPDRENNTSFSKRLFRRLAGINPKEQRLDPTLVAHDSHMQFSKNHQKLAGAEGHFHEAKPLDTHMKEFETAYSQLLIFKSQSRQVIYASKGVIDLFGLNKGNKNKPTFNSKLLQHDFAELIWPFDHYDKPSVTQLRNQLKEIIKHGVAVTMDCQVKLIEHKGFFSSNKDDHLIGKFKSTKIHLTPLKDKDGNAAAFTCLFAPRSLF